MIICSHKISVGVHKHGTALYVANLLYCLLYFKVVPQSQTLIGLKYNQYQIYKKEILHLSRDLQVVHSSLYELKNVFMRSKKGKSLRAKKVTSLRAAFSFSFLLNHFFCLCFSVANLTLGLLNHLLSTLSGFGRMCLFSSLLACLPIFVSLNSCW